jgi:hypothetical protein
MKTRHDLGVSIEAIVDSEAGSPTEALREPLAELRDRAERQLNAVRAAVISLLAVAAVAYAPRLTPSLRLINVCILSIVMAWTLGQYLLWYSRPRLPAWLAVANPMVDITAVTASMAGYGLTQSPALALKAPMFLAYFAVLAARPVTSSTRTAGGVAALTVVEYAALVAFMIGTGRVALTASPLAAAAGTGVAPLDEGAKLLFLAMAGAVATYATAWHERLVLRYGEAAHARQQLEVRLARAQFERLKHQLQPHFLFNALNTITALIRIDARAAERTVHGLGELLRLSLDGRAEHEVRLDRELELLGYYVEIQRLRFQDRLTVSVDVDPRARQAYVPNLLLQPLVENAIRHGIGPRAAGGVVQVHASCTAERLRLRVADDGVGATLTRQTDPSAREGIGLGNTRERLRYLYGELQRMTITTAPGRGFSVDIELPLRT